MRRLIEKKKRGMALSDSEWGWIVKEFTRGEIPDYQMSALLMAVWFQGMVFEETLALTREMMRSGTCLDLSAVSRATADKHSTGGVGDKVSLALAPLVACCGVAVPMVSGRGLGHTGGTLDKLASIPGFRIHLKPEEFVAQVERVGCAIMGQSDGMAPADGKMYSLRDVTATVDCNQLIAASILSKKLAAGPSALVMDVKIGRGAFMQSIEEGERLAELLIAIGEHEGRKVSALLTAMDQPLGFAVGNALEVKEVIELLNGRGPEDLLTVTVALAAEMIQITGVSDTYDEAKRLAVEQLESGAVLSKFAEMIGAQGGSEDVVEKPEQLLPKAPIVVEYRAEADGHVAQLDARGIGEIAVTLGAGRRRISEDVNPAVGLVLRAKVGQRVTAGAPVAFIHAENEIDALSVREELSTALVIQDHAPKAEALILERIDVHGRKPVTDFAGGNTASGD
jgi:pyrimidine-nucleoside phosphorylase